METKIFQIYLVIGFILVGWRLDIIKEDGLNDQQKESELSKALAVSWILFWLPLIIPSIIKIAIIILIMLWKKIAKTCKEMRERANEADVWHQQVRHLV